MPTYLADDIHLVSEGNRQSLWSSSDNVTLCHVRTTASETEALALPVCEFRTVCHVACGHLTSATNILKHYWRHNICLTRPQRCVTFYISALEILLLTYLLLITYLLRGFDELFCCQSNAQNSSVFCSNFYKNPAPWQLIYQAATAWHRDIISRATVQASIDKITQVCCTCSAN